jgi:5-methylcytosine-specific restriction endonuclease McrA
MPRPFNINNYHGCRKFVLIRDGYKCVLCGSTKRLCVDHILPFRLFEELRYSPDNCRTLCHQCHTKTDTYGGKMRNKKREDFLKGGGNEVV